MNNEREVNTMDKKQHDAIMNEYTKQLRASFTRGVSIGTKIGAEYVSVELGKPEEWAKMDRDQLIEKLIAGLAKVDEIKNANNKNMSSNNEGTDNE